MRTNNPATFGGKPYPDPGPLGSSGWLRKHMSDSLGSHQPPHLALPQPTGYAEAFFACADRTAQQQQNESINATYVFSNHHSTFSTRLELAGINRHPIRLHSIITAFIQRPFSPQAAITAQPSPSHLTRSAQINKRPTPA